MSHLVGFDGRPPGKLLPTRGTLFLTRPEAVGTYAAKSIILNFLIFLLPFFLSGLGVYTLGERLGVYGHESLFALMYTWFYFAYHSGIGLIFAGTLLFPRFFRFHLVVPMMLGVRRHRSHFSFMSQRRLNQICGKPKPPFTLFWDFKPTFTIFVTGFGSRSLPLPVTGNTTTADIYRCLESLGFVSTTGHEYYYFTYCGRRVGWDDTMDELGLGALSHLHLHLRVLGGVNGVFAMAAASLRCLRSRSPQPPPGSLTLAARNLTTLPGCLSRLPASGPAPTPHRLRQLHACFTSAASRRQASLASQSSPP
ncbi:hypothetical protein C8F04DRAFT_1174834 [Mycena alexandri]|uniref:Uncharacterized protein n=1 Tax=Mycena alexandri TaxID=1745969 RepID=A0AAD6TDD5_9AGAR|nr:hypothetical protein C8F04DRAFT_1174834 [Mycena alexandri]